MTSPDSFNPLGAIEKGLPGFGDFSKLIHVIPSFIGPLTSALASLDAGSIMHHLGTLNDQLEKAQAAIDDALEPSWESVTRHSVGSFFEQFMVAGLGVPADVLDQNATDGMDTMSQFLGFIVALPTAISAVQGVMKFALGERAPEAFFEQLRKIPEEMGFSWAIGMFMETLLEAAIGESLTEGIRSYKRTMRIDAGMLRSMMRNKSIDRATAEQLLAKIGFPDEQIELIANMTEAAPTASEVAQGIRYGLTDIGTLKDALERQGLKKEDIDWLSQLYISHVETEAGSVYRSTAEELAKAELIDMGTYAGILDAVHVPKEDRDDYINAVKLVVEHGKVRHSLEAIKLQYQHDHSFMAQAIAELKQMGYTDDAANELVKSWDYVGTTPGISVSLLLTYWASGVWPSRADAYRVLMAHHLTAEETNFLLDHPKAQGGRTRKLTPGLLVNAFLDGVIDEATLSKQLASLGMTDQEVSYQVQVAQWKKIHTRKAKNGNIGLSKGEIVDCWAFGIFDESTAVKELQALGYTKDAAVIILEIKNKGIFQAPKQPAFKNLNDAIAYLTAHGYKINAPLDPLIQEAEAVVWEHGYTVLPPLAATPA